MPSLIARFPMRPLACAAALSVTLPAVTVAAAHHPGAQHATPRWLVVNAKTHTATLTLIAAYSNAIGGFNFNGYGQGKMIVSVPVNYHVNAVFTNKATLPHSAMIVPYAQRTSSGSFTLAFPHASTPNPVQGSPKGKTEKFSFVASKSGTYALICPVPGHNAAGMWDVFKVTNGGSASISFKH